MTKTFAERCHIAQQFLPDAQYKAMLTALHTEMLAKLAEQPAQQEPVAYFNPQVKGGFYWAKPTKITAPVTVSVEPMPLYTTPQAQPKREWVGLTGDELNDLTAIYSGMPLYRAIEAKLRGKNHD